MCKTQTESEIFGPIVEAGVFKEPKIKQVQTMVWATLSFAGLHFWRDAKGKVAYLRHSHRHRFHVKVGKLVTGLDREIEFITLQEQVEDFVRQHYERKLYKKSCEMMAKEIMDRFDLDYCSVSEDNENGAVVWSGPVGRLVPIGPD
jgi:hypothetical protein